MTVPHKGAVIEFLDELDPSAKQTGAVNTIVQKNGKLYGHNTDASGFLLSLHKDGHFDPAGKKVVILGAGGAAAAVAMALAGAGVRRLVIANRNKTRAEILAKRVQRNFDRETLPVALDESRALYWLIRESDLLVNATSVGLKGHRASEHQPQQPASQTVCVRPRLPGDRAPEDGQAPGPEAPGRAGDARVAGRAVLRNLYGKAGAFPRHEKRGRTRPEIHQMSELRYLTAGESHGRALTAILEGMPAGVAVTEDDINQELARRQKGYGRGARMAIEADKVQVSSGIRWGETLGSPIAMTDFQ